MNTGKITDLVTVRKHFATYHGETREWDEYEYIKPAEIQIDLVVTRHKNLLKYLMEERILAPEEEIRVIDHAKPEDVFNKHVLGVLPHSLSALTKTFTEIPLHIPKEMRGKELTVDQIREYAGDPCVYIIRKID